jgi:hypothetical protein
MQKIIKLSKLKWFMKKTTLISIGGVVICIGMLCFLFFNAFYIPNCTDGSICSYDSNCSEEVRNRFFEGSQFNITFDGTQLFIKGAFLPTITGYKNGEDRREVTNQFNLSKNEEIQISDPNHFCMEYYKFVDINQDFAKVQFKYGCEGRQYRKCVSYIAVKK